MSSFFETIGQLINNLVDGITSFFRFISTIFDYFTYAISVVTSFIPGFILPFVIVAIVGALLCFILNRK